MAYSNFEFLEEEFPILFNIGQSAEYNLYSDPNVTMVKMRQFGEKATEGALCLYTHQDSNLRPTFFRTDFYLCRYPEPESNRNEALKQFKNKLQNLLDFKSK